MLKLNAPSSSVNRDQTQQNLFCKATWNFAKSGLKGSFTLSESDIAYRWALGKSDLLFASKFEKKFAFASVFGQCKWTLKEAAVCKKAHYAINMPHVFTDSPKAKCQTSSCYGLFTVHFCINSCFKVCSHRTTPSPLMGDTFYLFHGHCDGLNGLHTHFSPSM